MTLVRRRLPFSDLTTLPEAMDRLFRQAFIEPTGYMFAPESGFPTDRSAGHARDDRRAGVGPGYRA